MQRKIFFLIFFTLSKTNSNKGWLLKIQLKEITNIGE